MMQRLDDRFYYGIRGVFSELEKECSDRSIVEIFRSRMIGSDQRNGTVETLLARVCTFSDDVNMLPKKFQDKMSPLYLAEIDRLSFIPAVPVVPEGLGAHVAPPAPGPAVAVPGVPAVASSSSRPVASAEKVPVAIGHPNHSSHKRIVFATEDRSSFIVYNPHKKSADITVRTSDHSYVKLRNVAVRNRKDLSEAERARWVVLNSTSGFCLSLDDIKRARRQHKDGAAFGPYPEIKHAVRQFTKKIAAVAETVFVDDGNEKKVTTEMDEVGHIRVVEKSVIGTGYWKKVQKVTIIGEHLTGGEQTRVRAKIKDNHKGNDAAALAEMNRELVNFALLHAAGVPNVINIVRSPAQNRKKIRLDMPYMAGGTFKAMIEKEAIGQESYKKRLIYAHQLAVSLAAIHQNGYTYNDFKMENCLFDPKRDQAILGDLGTVKKLNGKANMGTYPAPEHARRKRDDSAIIEAKTGNDCWSFGLGLYALFHGKDAQKRLSQMHCTRTRDQILDGKKEIGSHLKEGNPIDDLIRSLLHTDASRRPPMHHVVAHLERLI